MKVNNALYDQCHAPGFADYRCSFGLQCMNPCGSGINDYSAPGLFGTKVDYSALGLFGPWTIRSLDYSAHGQDS